MNLSEWQLESEAAEQADKQTDRHLSHEHLAEEPHGEVHVVVLHGEVVPVEGHVEQVGHEGDLGDGGPQSPGEEVIDRSPVSLHTGKHHPAEAETPGGFVKRHVASVLQPE